MKVKTLIPIYAVFLWQEDKTRGLKNRRSALSVISAFRKVSTDAAVVIAEMILLKLAVSRIEDRGGKMMQEVEQIFQTLFT